MKKIVLLSFILLIGISTSNAQIEVGVKLGLNSTDLASRGFSVINDNQTSLDLFLQEANYGVHFGLY